MSTNTPHKYKDRQTYSDSLLTQPKPLSNIGRKDEVEEGDILFPLLVDGIISLLYRVLELRQPPLETVLRRVNKGTVPLVRWASKVGWKWRLGEDKKREREE